MTDPGSRPDASACRSCGYRLTWAERRRQYGRAIRRGLTPDQAKKIMPLCQKCTTVAVSGHPPMTAVLGDAAQGED